MWSKCLFTNIHDIIFMGWCAWYVNKACFQKESEKCKNLGLNKDKIEKCGLKLNFWGSIE